MKATTRRHLPHRPLRNARAGLALALAFAAVSVGFILAPNAHSLGAPSAGAAGHAATPPSSSAVRISGITGARDAQSALSGTVVVHAVVPPLRGNAGAGSGRLGAMAVLFVRDRERRNRSVAARASAGGTVAFVLDTAQLENGVCEIKVSDLRDRSATRRHAHP